jgi:ABC-2 type transport system permease protein
MIEGLSISYAQGEMGILMLMAVVLLLISLKKFNKRLE